MTSIPLFHKVLAEHGLTLRRSTPQILQINVGLLCNLACKHCHLEAGPRRTECMTSETREAIVAYADAYRFDLIDITGGAPEMNPELAQLLEDIAPLTNNIMVRTNLVALDHEERRDLMDLLTRLRVTVVASLPSPRKAQTDKVRGAQTHDTSITVLQSLNKRGYGQDGSGLELYLVSNPAGAFLPAEQSGLERRFKKELSRNFGITFNKLLVLPNAPLGRFRTWLEASGNLTPYLQSLVSAFNPGALCGVMCRETVSIAWDGTLYDCDFNQAAHRPMVGGLHVRDMVLPSEGQTIATGDHCFACTAGSGFT
ncbi:arsenosugar biosynthesis radical SAM (seleno)protein ArsS [Desulfovibrio inopinatus]|uniref:arsenosugar biosynthesis radical SAM (seleno)protein ArsS n=1 Tax=Desulfovibrio inopinatus TaxID=102109 RepID=UPI00040C1BC4|nr:arsenosugar biosynthesis radical SAM (seleno)protein ArsS [Desulfovibrio inopinatus]